ncbi:head-tail adaptor protein [Cypionkella psychrotolerans]|uniref:head-tail adaptor protein n=1 Tax=Cypionkella psychrotolerans TaxID=1678131 RepID=UPI0006B60EF7|nr:head-tail adaptor protein [Cypionkella psychrotolerans]
MNPVRLTRKLVLEAPQNIADGAGGFAQAWAVLGTIWGEVSPGPGREMAGVEVVLAQVPYKITVRGAPVGNLRRPKPEQRLRDGTRVFTILAVAEHDQDAQYLTCFAREEVPT